MDLSDFTLTTPYKVHCACHCSVTAWFKMSLGVGPPIDQSNRIDAYLLQDKFSKKARAKLFDFSSSQPELKGPQAADLARLFANGRPQTPGCFKCSEEDALSSRGQATHVMARPPEAD